MDAANEDGVYRVVIVGGGIAGLSLANCLLHRGCTHFVVLEREGGLALSTSQGFSLTIQQKGLRALREGMPGVAERLKGESAPQREQSFWDGRRGTLMHERVFGEEQRMPVPRVRLREALLKDVASHLHWGETVVAIEEDAKDGSVICTTASGKRWVARELLAACDGVRSRVRSLVAPEVPLRRFPLMNVYGVARLADLEPAHAEVFRGKEVQVLDGDLRFFSKPFDAACETQMYQVCFGETDESRRIFERQRETGHAQAPELLAESRALCIARVRAWHQGVQFVSALLEASQAQDCIVHELCDIGPDFPPCRVGRVLFLGDALHAMSPYLGQGANSAMADAHVVVQALPLDGSLIDMATIRALHQTLAGKSARTVAASRKVTEFYHSSDCVDVEKLFSFKRWPRI